jgi:hypothetical protein
MNTLKEQILNRVDPVDKLMDLAASFGVDKLIAVGRKDKDPILAFGLVPDPEKKVATDKDSDLGKKFAALASLLGTTYEHSQVVAESDAALQAKLNAAIETRERQLEQGAGAWVERTSAPVVTANAVATAAL